MKFKGFVPACCAFGVLAVSQLAIPTATAAHSETLRIEIVADDMCCKGCAQKVGSQLYAAPGVVSVEADVPSRTVIVTAKPSPKLTAERLWLAVEKGKGGPSKLSTPDVTYEFIRSESLKPEERMAAGKHTLIIRALADQETAQRIANQLYAIPGAQDIAVDLAQHALFVTAKDGGALSPWALAGAVERAQAIPETIHGPYGLMRIQQTAGAQQGETPHAAQSPSQGGIR